MNNNHQNKRLLSLDVLRGMTVAGMILVNDGYGDTFAPLQHSAWNGMTPCDLVFPFFLFIMGVSTYLSLRKYQFRWSATVGRKILKRTTLIFLIGLGINWLANGLGGDWGWSHLRIMAVMQRIALCYCAASVFALSVNHKYTLHVSCALLIGYAIILLAGNGYAAEALRAVLEYLTVQEGIARVIAWCASDNIASKRTLEKAGMRLSGIVAGGLEVDGQRYDKIENTYSDQESE